jgi:type I restriction enzyme S subunit
MNNNVAGASSSMDQSNREQDAPATPRLRFPEFRDAEGWKKTSLGNITTKTDKRNTGGTSYPVYSISNSMGFIPQSEQFDGVDSEKRGYDISLYKLIQENTFAYNPARINVGSIGYSGALNNVIISSLYVCFQSHPIGNDSFLQQFFKSSIFEKSVNDYVEGGIRSYLFYENFSRIPIALPSLPEQQRIADCLSSLDAVIAAQARKVDALKTHKKGLMQQLFPRDGETQPRLRFPEFQDAGEWEKKVLADACRMQAGKFVPASGINERFEDGMFPCYGGNGLRGFTATYTHDGFYPLIGRQGALCGNIKLASGKFHATEHAVVATHTRGINVVWLYYMLDLLELNRFATGQAQPGLSVDVLEKIPVSIPPTLPEQQRIADCLSSLDAVISAATQRLAALKTHKQGLMQQLFPSMDEVAS